MAGTLTMEDGMIAKKSKTKTSKKTNRGVLWSDEATKTLIDIWSDEDIQLYLENSKSSKETREVYRSVMVQMQKREYQQYTLDHIINKIKKLRQKYKLEFDKKKRSGKGRGKTWKFFDGMNEILGHRPNVQPTFCIDTSAEECTEKKGDDENKDNVVHHLMEKFGQGEMLEEICPKCGYCDDGLFSAGVHESTSGCVRVYTEDDQFVCPRCANKDTGNDGFEDNVNNDLNSTPLNKETTEANINQNLNQLNKETTEADIKQNLKVKHKKKSNFERGIEVVCEQFNASSNNEMEWLMKMEEEHHKRDIDMQLKQAKLENERRQQDREHEMKLFSLLIGARGGVMDSMAAPHTMSTYPYQWPDQASFNSYASCSSDTNGNPHYTSL